MLRTMSRRGTMPDVVLAYSAVHEDDMCSAELRELAESEKNLRLYERFTDADGMLTPDQLDDVCPDWRERETWACGPAPMLDATIEHYEKHDRVTTSTSSGSRWPSTRATPQAAP